MMKCQADCKKKHTTICSECLKAKLAKHVLKLSELRQNVTDRRKEIVAAKIEVTSLGNALESDIQAVDARRTRMHKLREEIKETEKWERIKRENKERLDRTLASNGYKLSTATPEWTDMVDDKVDLAEKTI